MKNPRIRKNHQPSLVEQYVERVLPRLGRIFDTPVKDEWIAMEGETGLYSPRLDIAIGPFAFTERYIALYDLMVGEHALFLNSLVEHHIKNVRCFDDPEYTTDLARINGKNINARCFLAIEIENKVSRKHLMGGAINASALGRIGIALAYTPDKLKAFVKLRKYLEFLISVGKNSFDSTNLLILDKEPFSECIDQEISRRQIHALQVVAADAGQQASGAAELVR